MLNTAWAIIRGGKIELLEKIELQEGSKVLVTFLSEEDSKFWLQASQSSLDKIWGNVEDDVYAQLLKK